MPTKIPIIGLTPGSESGVGPELMLRALHDNAIKSKHFFWCGDKRSLELAAQRIDKKLSFANKEALLANGTRLSFLAESETLDPLKRQAWFLKKASELGLSGQLGALVTGPIEKAALGYLGDFPGQTEYFAKLWGKPETKAFMAFTGGPFTLSLVTTHLPLARVSKHITASLVHDHISELVRALAPLLNKEREAVSIDVLGLNPHAGEGGLLGEEEQELIAPALDTLRNKGYKVQGPLAADGYFAYLEQKHYPDAVVAMYHDQGLIPYKMLSKKDAVNITFGLKIPRLSPAHGTASNLVGTGLACMRSTLKAILLAEQMAL